MLDSSQLITHLYTRTKGLLIVRTSQYSQIFSFFFFSEGFAEVTKAGGVPELPSRRIH